MRSESTNAFGQPSETKPTAGTALRPAGRGGRRLDNEADMNSGAGGSYFFCSP
jgi:hypothetical protein